MKALVIGGNRFIGYFLVQKLLGLKCKVSILNRGSNKGVFGSRVEEIICDRDDKKKFISEVSKREFDFVFDNCAYKPEQVKISLEAFTGKIRQYILLSTVAVYNKGDKLPYAENSARNGRNPFESYGEEKAECENVLFAQDKMPYTIIRPTYVYGPNDYTDRMDKLFRQVDSGQAIRIPKSNPVSQFVYVHNVASALAAAAGNQKALGEAYNICGEEKITYGELVEMIGEIVGKEPKVSYGMTPDFPFEDWEMHSDVSKSRKGLKIKYTPLRQGLKETWEGLQEQSGS